MRAALYSLAVFSLVACGDDFTSDRLPTASSFTIRTAEDTPATKTVEASDPDGDSLSVTIVSGPEHGTAVALATSLTYTPAANYSGEDRLVVAISDGTHAIEVTGDITVDPVNDAPVGGADSIAAEEDAPRTVTAESLLANDADIDGDALTITAVGVGTRGTATLADGSVTFTPDADFSGVGGFEYTLSDGTASTQVAVSVSIGEANDAPVAVADVVETPEDTAIIVPNPAANDSDPDGNLLEVTGVATPTNGTVVLASGAITFTPAADFVGTAGFDYTVSDGVAQAVGHVTVEVTAVNDGPTATGDSGFATAEDTALELPFAAVLANDSDIDSALTVSDAGAAVNGTITRGATSLTFTPAANFHGAASFEYTVSDGTLTAVARVDLTVTPVNDAPVAAPDLAETDEDTAVVLADLAANDSDVDGDALVVTAVGNAVNGAVALNGGSPRFVPAPNFSGAAGFDYTVSDGTLIANAHVTINVGPVNDPPVAGPDRAEVGVDGSIQIPFTTLLANDTDGGDGATLAVTGVANATHGTATLGANAVRFVPDAGFVGEATFDYTVSDGTDATTGHVLVTVTAGPVCGDGVVAGDEDCDDGNPLAGDGCAADCAVEPGFECIGSGPSSCSPICGDGLVRGDEQCDDNNLVDTDGCTSRCVPGAVCTAAAVPGGARYATDPDSGHCYVAFESSTTFDGAEAACVAGGGHLATIASTAESLTVVATLAAGQNPWIGARDDANDTDAVFDWVTTEAFGFANFAPGQPDDDVNEGGNGECLHIVDAAGRWNDTNCAIDTFVVGRVCEYETTPCGDSILQTAEGEECDDANRTAGDGCTADCQLEVGCGNGTLDPGERCDDDNVVDGDGCDAQCQFEGSCGNGIVEASEGEDCDDGDRATGDGCSATCQFETLARFSFTGASNQATFPADGTEIPPALSAVPVMSRGAGIAIASAQNVFNANGWSQTLTANEFFSFTLAPAAGGQLRLFEITFDEQRSGTGPANFVVRSSLDNFTTDLATGTTTNGVLGNHVVALPAATFATTGTVELRFFGFGTSNAAGTWRLDNVVVHGGAAP